MSLLKTEPIPFRVWYPENKEDLNRQFQSMKFVEETDCETCDGDGVFQCDLGEDHECDKCDGSGKIEQTYEDALYDYALDEYHAQVAKDRNIYNQWVTREALASCP